MNWFRIQWRKFAVFYFGGISCKHLDVEVVTAQQVTLKPLRGRCRACGRGVRAITLWKDV